MLYNNNEQYPKPKHFSLNRGQMFPEKMLLLDYCFDENENWLNWQKHNEDLTGCGLNSPDAYFNNLIVPTSQSTVISYWLELCIKLTRPLLIIGPTGTGKSAVVNHYLSNLPVQKNSTNIINFSAKTSAQLIQKIVMSKLDRRRKSTFGPPLGKQVNYF